ncbi:lipid IV(A) 3-deoxy-D-manno-octulosonic acid transferase [Marinimicrobium sp. ABcell2]|uniref:lipid IV(A) 3-deoxy-D-manno-octulosonic acid transferase n=1 Tax=Marinimicrobium sp. ABcell2 TaxID=3069751 RepID=UPI0027B393C3|nr:lipid IV(A) 3-deoxy-D-manno-octulosonic acid transferase [Marinimicrobium sp. ABcell2]MDQ2076480.1 lipid IV(A) 3-deoxy-D-manno-octulosonic acid transferase [Marinimicrobium sp. ABcell2]
MRLVYSLILYLATPLVLVRLLWRALRAPDYADRWGERFGWVPNLKTDKTVIWLHTVSVGEFLGALPLVRALLQEPDVQLVITTTTPTGSERVRATLGDRVRHVYAPYDLPDCVARFLKRTQPRVLLIMETELWPNTIAACAKREIPVVLINGRLSAKSARGYQRFAGLTRPMLQRLTAAGVQGQADAERFQALGLSPEACQLTGNIKFDLTLDEGVRERAAQLREEWTGGGQRPVWIAASTHQGEDEPILEAYVQLSRLVDANPLLVLVPRHPERFDSVTALCRRRDLATVRRSLQEPVDDDIQVLVGDTMGELLLFFGASDIAFVGGSLIPNGGHNLVEPAAWGLPLLSGPSQFNFAEISRLLIEAGALTLAETPEQLAKQLAALIQDPELRRKRGEAALAVTEGNRGALEKTLELVKRYW